MRSVRKGRLPAQKQTVDNPTAATRPLSSTTSVAVKLLPRYNEYIVWTGTTPALFYYTARKGNAKDGIVLMRLIRPRTNKDELQDEGVNLHGNSSTLHDEDCEERKQQWNAEARETAEAGRKAAKNQVRFNVIKQDELREIPGFRTSQNQRSRHKSRTGFR